MTSSEDRPEYLRSRKGSALGWLDSSASHNSKDIAAQKAVVLHAYRSQRADPVSRQPEASLHEAVNLTVAINLDVVAAQTILLRRITPATLLGSGQVKSVASLIEQQCATIVMINGVVSPIQQRNLEKAWNVKVIDRIGLILEIFGDRAHSREGVLQVELAHLSYQQSRLVRSWTHLERQRGGFGFLGGPGETQIETDRRLIRDRIARLKSELADVERTRLLHRQQRKKRSEPIVALVGYTNAGKSTLFNRLSGADVMAEDLLFATLDPTMRGVDLDKNTHIIISDTVGFISELPAQLVAAFKATLEEVRSADILLHVRDAAHPDTEPQRLDVISILKDIGIDTETSAGPPIIEVLNKFDLLDAEAQQAVLAQSERKGDRVALSAVTGEGIDGLINCLKVKLDESSKLYEVELPIEEGKKLAWLHAHGKVMSQTQSGKFCHVAVRLKSADWARFNSMAHVT